MYAHFVSHVQYLFVAGCASTRVLENIHARPCIRLYGESMPAASTSPRQNSPPQCTSSRKTSPLGATARVLSQHPNLLVTSTTFFPTVNMADRSDDSTRPAKRARLDENAPSTLSTETSATAPQAAPTAPAPLETDLDREVRAGITEYVCPNNLGFIGVLKQRYTDFLVNEIGLDGQVLHLRSTEAPEKKGEQKEIVKATNGTEKEEAKPAMTVAEEVKGDAEMQDTGVDGEATLKLPVQAEDAPEKIQDNGEQIIGGPQPAVKAEPEEEVGIINGACGPETLTHPSSRTKTVRRYTRYSASRPQTTSSSLCDKCEGRRERRRESSRLSYRRPSPTRTYVPKHIRACVGYFQTYWRAEWRRTRPYESRPLLQQSARRRAKAKAEIHKTKDGGGVAWTGRS
jgi:hypothetical protein